MNKQRVQADLSLIQEFLAATGREDMQRLRELMETGRQLGAEKC